MATETPTCIISIKIVIHIFDAKTFICINPAETSNCIITTETVTCIVETERSTNVTVTESNNDVIAIEHQNLHNCNRRWHPPNYYRKYQLHSSNRNCHLQNWLQKLSLAEMVPVRDSFSYNKEIKQMSKHQTLRQNSFSITCITQWRNSTRHSVNQLCYILITSIFLSSCILQTK